MSSRFCVLPLAAFLFACSDNDAGPDDYSAAPEVTVTESSVIAEPEDIAALVTPALPAQALTSQPPAPAPAAPLPPSRPKVERAAYKPAAPAVKTTFSLIDAKGFDFTKPSSSFTDTGGAEPEKQPSQAEPPPPEPRQPVAPPHAPLPPAAAKPQFKDYANPSKTWSRAYTSNFNIFTDTLAAGIPTPNAGLTLEEAYAALRMNIPLPMPSKSNVYIYKNKASYMTGEFKPYPWSEAVFFPPVSTIVLYNNSGDRASLKRLFMHEFTHMINESYFNPEGENSSMPLWLDEGTAVNMEDVSENTYGGEWAADLLKKRIYPFKLYKPGTKIPADGSVMYFARFSDFMQPDSLDKYAAAGRPGDWYLQAYAMVRFLWKPYNAPRPENQGKFKTFLTLLKEGGGRSYGVEEALKKAYGFKAADDFETKFWAWYNDLRKRYDPNALEKNKSKNTLYF